MKKLLNTKKGGFTILETLVAIFIITIAIMATLTAAQMGLQSSFYARDQITAFYLAEEAVEQVRNIRDSNYVATTSCSWLTGGDESLGCHNDLAACVTSIGTDGPDCSVDTTSDINTPSIVPCAGSECVLKLSDTIGYNHSAVSATNISSKYSRKINIKLKSANEAEITAKVTWTSGVFATRSFTVKEVLFDWNLR